MAIVSSGHRVAARGASPSADAAQRQQVAAAVKLEDSEVSTESDLSDKGVELCQAGEFTSAFPFELFDLPDLKSVLSLETWNFCLSEEEREQLMAFMPAELDQDTFSTTLKELLSGANIYFGNPVSQLFEQMKGGLCQPRMAQFREGLKCLQRKEHYHLLRKYHNNMVSSFVEMQKLWEEYPDVEIEGRLEIWRKWKDTKVKPQLPKASEKFKTVQKIKVPENVVKLKDGKLLPSGSKTSKPASVLKAVKPGLPVQKGVKAASKVAAKSSKKAAKVEADAPSPASEADTLGGNESPAGGTSSSLTSGEKKRKSSGTGNTLSKRMREEESLTSSEDDELSTPYAGDFQDNEEPSTSGRKDVVKTVSTPQGSAEGHCLANSEANNEEVDTQKKRVKRKVAVEKESSESPPKLSRRLGSTFPFSIMSFLSALRRALITPCGPVSDRSVEAACIKSNISGPSSPSEENGSEDASKVGLFCVPFAEVVRRVYANPGDAKVLEVHEPLQDLVWGALKVLSSKVAPAGAKGWKPLATYEKETKSWYWIGPPPPQGSVDDNGNTKMDDWGVPSKILVKLEEAFATWYRHGEATRQQMVQLQLPPPPVVSAVVDDRERFRDMRAQKSLITISPSSEDMRAYFRKEEVLRYSVPDRAFAYTRSDGRKSVVAPLRRGGGKPNSKARDHFMLKPDRPPHVTILCLVRDAAARLPGGVGTRADVCALIRDSQYVVEDVSEAQVNQVVSGALDRLHYERDPCVRFDGERKLWAYLHTDRNEEDFEDDGTSSTKRWKKQKKDPGDAGELQVACFDNSPPPGMDQESNGAGAVAGVGGGGYGMELRLPDGNNPSAIYSAGRTELVYNKSGSLTSPRVLNNGSLTEDPGMPFMELPPSVEELQRRAPWDAPAASVWNQQALQQAQEPEQIADDFDAAAAQRDADAMIGGDAE